MTRRSKKKPARRPKNTRRSRDSVIGLRRSKSRVSRGNKSAVRAPTGPGFIRKSFFSMVDFIRAKRQLWLRMGEALCVVVVLVVVAAGTQSLSRYMKTSSAFEIHEIEVNGIDALTKEKLLAVAELSLGDNIFSVSVEDLDQKLKTHPWIASVESRRVLPNKLKISVVEHVPVALMALDGQLFFVSNEGFIFKRVEKDDAVDLPLISGISRDRFFSSKEYRNAVLLDALALVYDYRTVGLEGQAQIEELHVERSGALSLYIGDEPVHVRLGHGPYRSKLRRLNRVLAELKRRNAKADYIYLDNRRRPERVSVKLKGQLFASADN